MGAFICQVSEIDWLLSRKIGVYGNREGSERDGNIVYFDRTRKGDEIIQSIIEDLIGMRKGDIVFFHVVKTAEGESLIHGIYKVREEPFYNDKEKFWKSSPHFSYPYRFCFEPHPDHVELCKYDASVSVSEFYRSIENRDIRSILTLEREVRGAAHAVKKIMMEDAEVIEKLLYRDFYYRHIEEPIDFQPIQMQMEPLKNHIRRIGEIEFAIKAFAAHELGRRSQSLIQFIPACKNSEYDFLIESFIGQTTRKPTDILCISSSAEKAVTIMEVKTDQARMDDLVQSLNYLELFKLRNLDRGSLNYKMSVCLLAQRFHPELVNYVSLRNNFLPWEETILLKYMPTQNGKTATFALQGLPKPQFTRLKTYPRINIIEESSQISSDPSRFYAKLDKKIPPRAHLELLSFQENVIILQKYYIDGGKKTALGHVLIYVIRGKCAPEDFVKFLNLIHKEVNIFEGDLKAVEPVIIAEDYDDLVNFFIEEYNKYETHARRQPISAFILPKM